MRTDFEWSLEYIFKREGGFVNHPADSGGPTNFGITQATLSTFRGTKASLEDVQNLSREEAAQIYEERFWKAMRLDRIRSKKIALILFDQGVHRGPIPAIKTLQQVLNIHFRENLEVDGIIGHRTEVAVATAREEKLCRKLIQAAQMNYVQLALKNPTQNVFLVGWLNRSFALCDAISV